MPKKSIADDFQIHVDSSCLTNSTDLKLPAKRNDSDQTVIHVGAEQEERSPSPEEPQRMNYEPPSVGSDNESEIASSLGYRGDESNVASQVSRDRHTEALIRSAARAVVASIEHDNYRTNDSDLSGRTNEDTEISFLEGTELSYDGVEQGYQSELDAGDRLQQQHGTNRAQAEEDDPYDGSASSHHEDDVFSEHSGSHRSSLNSSDEQHTDEEQRRCTDDEQSHQEAAQMSRMPSTYSVRPEVLASPPSPSPRTPSSKVLARPPFRTPSSVRALQLSSPTPSVLGGPRSNKRPASSRSGTPQSQSPSKIKTPGQFKAKKEYPLVLLHVTVLPLDWQNSALLDAITTSELSRDLASLKESWTLLQSKLTATLLTRGVLLPHPQDSFETLSERLLTALELPVRPRARILSCGHYVGPNDLGFYSSEEESISNHDDSNRYGAERSTALLDKWCDICGCEVRYENCDLGDSAATRQRYKIKVYASNGLMGAGAWSASWREMERIDVEIEPLVTSRASRDLTAITTIMEQHTKELQEEHTQEVDQEHYSTTEHVPLPEVETRAFGIDDLTAEDRMRRERDAERLREIYGHDVVHEVEAQRQPVVSAAVPKHDTGRPQGVLKYGDSLPELLVAAFKVAMRDRKNIVILGLSLLVLLLAVRPGRTDVHPELLAFDRSEDGFRYAEDVGAVLEEKATHTPADITSPVIKTMTDVTDDVSTIIEQVVESAGETMFSVEDMAEVETPSEEIEAGNEVAKDNALLPEVEDVVEVLEDDTLSPEIEV